jgi:murein DD-endopeptidase MepM/ murein hydrolase activator NlpD
MIHLLLRRLAYIFFFLVLAFTWTSCGSNTGVKALFQQRTPYEAYAQGLRQAGLHRSALGQAWILAGQKALQDSLLVTLPFQETAYFRADQPSAAAYSFRAHHGEMLEVRVATRTRQDIRLFLDLFEAGSTLAREVKQVAAADTTNIQLSYRVAGNQVYLVRLQPELLKSGSFTITISTKPSLAFPVQGKNSRDLQSFWGAARDAGARQHEGVDIFAAKGTPVLASARGLVTQVNETPVGGKVVWLADAENRQSIYYAHLDRQLVQAGQLVAPGDTLGLVGTTGNARGSHPHLHFGIYARGGAVDPFPFIHQNNSQPAPLRVNASWLGEWARSSKRNSALRIGPQLQAATLALVPRHTAVQVLGGSGNWFRVALPNGLQGYLQENHLEKIIKPVSTRVLVADAELVDQPLPLAAPMARIRKNSPIAVLGIYQMYQLVRLTDGTLGWLNQQI